MACCTPSLPSSITAGLTFQAALTLLDYPAPDWSVLTLPGVAYDPPCR